MKTILKKELWLIILCLAVLSCKKEALESGNHKVENTKYKNILDTVAVKSYQSMIKANLETIRTAIPDSVAADYIARYKKEFPESEFSEIYLLDKYAYDNILSGNNYKGYAKFVLTENNKMLDIIYQNAKGEKFSISDYDSISDEKFSAMDKSFRNNIYKIMNERINRLNSTLTENTREILVPLSDLKKLQPTNKSIIVLLPGIITGDTSAAGWTENQKHHFTLIAFAVTISIDRNGVEKFIMGKTVLYDNFCISPPNNC